MGLKDGFELLAILSDAKKYAKTPEGIQTSQKVKEAYSDISGSIQTDSGKALIERINKLLANT